MAGPTERVDQYRASPWARLCAGLERVACGSTESRHAGDAPTAAADPWNHNPSRGGALAASHQSADTAVVLVVGTYPTRSERGLAGLHCPLLNRTYLPLLQTNPQVDDAQIAHASRGRPLDLAAPPGVCPAPLGTRRGRRHTPALATTLTTGAPHPGTRPSRLFAAPCTYGQPCERAKTLRTVARTSSRHALSARSTLPGGQIDSIAYPRPMSFAFYWQ